MVSKDRSICLSQCENHHWEGYSYSLIKALGRFVGSLWLQPPGFLSKQCIVLHVALEHTLTELQFLQSILNYTCIIILGVTVCLADACTSL